MCEKRKLPNTLIMSLDSLSSVYNIGSSTDSLPNLPLPWKAVGLGGDNAKLLASNTELDIFVKRYAHPEYAKLAYLTHEIVRPVVTKAQFPLLMPTQIYEDMLIFQLLKLNDSYHDHGAMRLLAHLTTGISLPLPLSGFLSALSVSNGDVIYADPFEDSIASFITTTGIHPNISSFK